MELFRERYPKVKNVGYQRVGFTCVGFIRQTSTNEFD